MTEVVAGAAGPAAVEVYKDGRSLLTSAGSRIAYVKDLKKNYKKLMQEARKLWELRDGIETEISRHKISQVTREWIVKVEMITREVGELETKYNDEKKNPWRLLRVWPHSNLSKDMADKHGQVQILLEEGKIKRGVLVAELPKPVRKIHAPKIEDNSSLHKVVEDVVSFLDDKQIRIIGIWGRVGTGKTTIMQNLDNHKDIAKMFDIVIWAPVSKEWSLKNLQGAIMQRLKLNVESTAGIEENAWRISEELKGKKFLILVDEIFDLIDLHEVMGIQDNLESKVVLASRLRDICKDMEADELINVKPLSDHEAFNMFKEKVGRSIHFLGIKPVAELVVRECGGLPLLIDRVARTFRKKERNVSLWRDALNNLRRWENTQGMDEVLEFLRFCYDNLDSDAKKVCFLYGALYPEEYDIYIDYLLECWRAEGFIPAD